MGVGTFQQRENVPLIRREDAPSIGSARDGLFSPNYGRRLFLPREEGEPIPNYFLAGLADAVGSERVRKTAAGLLSWLKLKSLIV